MISIINKSQKFKNTIIYSNLLNYNHYIIKQQTCTPILQQQQQSSTLIFCNNNKNNKNDKIRNYISSSGGGGGFKIKNSGESIILGKKNNKLKNSNGSGGYIEEFNYPYNDIISISNSGVGGVGVGVGVGNENEINNKQSFKDKVIFNEILSISIDEAGKGALLGPLFVSCVVLDNESESYLRSMGVTDSKKLTPKRREYLYDIIIEHALYYQTIVLSADKIDQRRESHTLNQIETNLFYQLINDSIQNLPFNQPCKIIIDSIESNTEKYAQPFKIQFPQPTYQIFCETKADYKFISVGAASIIAKVERDRWIKQLEQQLSLPIGSGYPSDPLTINYVNNYFKSNFQYPSSMRKSWKFTGAEKEFGNLSSTLDQDQSSSSSSSQPQEQLEEEDEEDEELLTIIQKQKEKEKLVNLEKQILENTSTITLSSPSPSTSTSPSSTVITQQLTKKEQREQIRIEKELLKKEKRLEKEKLKLEKEEIKKNKPPTTKKLLDLLLIKLNKLEEQMEKIQDRINNNNNNNNDDK